MNFTNNIEGHHGEFSFSESTIGLAITPYRIGVVIFQNHLDDLPSRVGELLFDPGIEQFQFSLYETISDILSAGQSAELLRERIAEVSGLLFQSVCMLFPVIMT